MATKLTAGEKEENKETAQTTPPEPTDPNANKTASEKPETPVEKTEPEIVKSGFTKVKIKDFRGSYMDAKFDDDGVCERISKETLEALVTQFPGAVLLSAEEVN